MISENEFKVLNALRVADEAMTQRALAVSTSLSLGTVNATVNALINQGYMKDGFITESGRSALTPHKVQNAIIMAAGLSSRFAPISYEMPKGLLTVKGEVLIERQIRQLKEAGITDITVVVGYKKENFFYLEQAMGVEIRVNAVYDSRNNNSTLKLVEDKLSNTYICSSDDYFTENVFEPYVYKAYYSCVWAEGETDEYVVETGSNNRIIKAYVGGKDMPAMLGHVYFDQEFSKEFVRVLNEDYDLPATAQKLWEDIYIDHINTLDMVMRLYPDDVVYEFDSLADLQQFDPEFISNVDSTILDNICTYFGCARVEISDIVPIKQGLTNLSFRFRVGENLYVYRHPGVGTDEIISRESETISLQIAKELGIDDTFLYEDAQDGWKLSHFIPDCIEFDYHNPDHVKEAMRLIRLLHTSGKTTPFESDLIQKADELIELLRARNFALPKDFSALYEIASMCKTLSDADNIEPCLCHVDFYGPNLLVAPDRMHLIDWEYSAMSDYASDLGVFVACSDYSVEEALEVFNEYFEGKATEEQIRHCVAYTAISAFYWYVWALYKEATGDAVGSWLYLWYRTTQRYGALAKELYAK